LSASWLHGNRALAEIRVELWAARIPGIGGFADHHWFVVHRNDMPERWEVWQTKGAGGEHWGHLHRNLKPAFDGVGNGPGRLLKNWVDQEAHALTERIHQAPSAYPWKERYILWPGPNSNTFVQWVLEDRCTLGWRGCGKHYARLWGTVR
jgi:hypothetical protein